MFQDKLSPRWQFAAWGILAMVLLVPAGLGGRYVLFNWPMLVEMAKSVQTGTFGTLTQVTAPVPLPADWSGDLFFAVYTAGVVWFLLRYAAAYIRLRRGLGKPAACPRLQAVAERYHLPVCRAVEVPGLPSAFVCGLFRPVLVLPVGVEVDEKVLLHELLHLKYWDVLWGIVICCFRCLHWCNPLLWYCADLAGNDLESLCDQRALERLTGEDRRDYGRILLSMADEKYARAPGTSSMSNGGRNIRRRIEAIVRFKKYPQGMALVSVCILLTLAEPLLLGRNAEAAQIQYRTSELQLHAAMAAARTTWCTTYAGAFDTYAKAVADSNAIYRAMCAPLEEQNALASCLRRSNQGNPSGRCSWDDSPLYQTVQTSAGYQIYNLTPTETGGYTGLLAVKLLSDHLLAVQRVRAEQQGDRWVVLPSGDFQTVKSKWDDLYGHREEALLPVQVYEAQAGDITLRVRLQTSVDGMTAAPNGILTAASFDPIPKPGRTFDIYYRWELSTIYTGDPADKSRYLQMDVSSVPIWAGKTRYDVITRKYNELNGSWEYEIYLGSDGKECLLDLPVCFDADLFLDGKRTAELTLLPVEGDMHYD